MYGDGFDDGFRALHGWGGRRPARSWQWESREIYLDLRWTRRDTWVVELQTRPLRGASIVSRRRTHRGKAVPMGLDEPASRCLARDNAIPLIATARTRCRSTASRWRGSSAATHAPEADRAGRSGECSKSRSIGRPLSIEFEGPEAGEIRWFRMRSPAPTRRSRGSRSRPAGAIHCSCAKRPRIRLRRPARPCFSRWVATRSPQCVLEYLAAGR